MGINSDNKDDDEAWKCAGEGTYYGSEDALDSVANKDGDIHRQYSWEGLCHGKEVEKLFVLEPVVFVYYLGAY